MIIAGQVQHSVQDEDFYLRGSGVPEALGVAPRYFGADGDVTTILSRKGEHVCGLVLAAKTPIQLLNLLAAGDENRNFTGDASQLSRTRGKASQSLAADPINCCFKDDHGCQNEIGRASWPSR